MKSFTKKSIVLFIVMALGFTLSGCGNNAGQPIVPEPEGQAIQSKPDVVIPEKEYDTSKTVEEGSTAGGVLWEGAVSCEPGVDYQEYSQHPLIRNVPRLHYLASVFIRYGSTSFADQFPDLNELFEKGIQYNAGRQFRPFYDIFETIRFGAKCETEVIGDLRIGDSTLKMRELFGEPHFYNSDLKLAGYRFPSFYLFCAGEELIHEISMTSTFVLPHRYQNIVSDSLSSGRIIDYSVLDTICKLYPEYNWYYPGGFYQELLYSNGVYLFASDEPGFVLVWNNYEGEIMTHTPDTLQYIDEDMYFYYLSQYYRREQTIFEREDAVYSVDGNIAAFPNNAGRPVEGDRIDLRWLDESHCDITIPTSHAQSDLLWLNNRYLLFNVYLNEPFYFDVLHNEIHSLRESAEIPDGDAIEIRYEKLDGDKIHWNAEQLGNAEPQYIIHYSFDKEGNILFQAERIG